MRVENTVLGWIDLDHVLVVTDIQGKGDAGWGYKGWEIHFEVYLAFRDSPIIFGKTFDTKEKIDCFEKLSATQQYKDFKKEHANFIRMWKSK